eukprot:956489-Pleurochrysis_carterae.AAC.2
MRRFLPYTPVGFLTMVALPTLHSKGIGRPPFGAEASLCMASTTHNAATAMKAAHSRMDPMRQDAPERLTDIRLQRNSAQALCQGRGQDLLPWRTLAERLPGYTLEELGCEPLPPPVLDLGVQRHHLDRQLTGAPASSPAAPPVPPAAAPALTPTSSSTTDVLEQLAADPGLRDPILRQRIFGTTAWPSSAAAVSPAAGGGPAALRAPPPLPRSSPFADIAASVSRLALRSGAAGPLDCSRTGSLTAGHGASSGSVATTPGPAPKRKSHRRGKRRPPPTSCRPMDMPPQSRHDRDPDEDFGPLFGRSPPDSG